MCRITTHHWNTDSAGGAQAAEAEAVDDSDVMSVAVVSAEDAGVVDLGASFSSAASAADKDACEKGSLTAVTRLK